MSDYSIAFIVIGIVSPVIYALYCKGDIFFEASHGGSSVRLQAKERPARRKQR